MDRKKINPKNIFFFVFFLNVKNHLFFTVFNLLMNFNFLGVSKNRIHEDMRFCLFAYFQWFSYLFTNTNSCILIPDRKITFFLEIDRKRCFDHFSQSLKKKNCWEIFFFCLNISWKKMKIDQKICEKMGILASTKMRTVTFTDRMWVCAL